MLVSDSGAAGGYDTAHPLAGPGAPRRPGEPELGRLIEATPPWIEDPLRR